MTIVHMDWLLFCILLKCPRTEFTFDPLSSLLPSPPLSLSWNKNNLSITHIIAEKLRKTDQSSVFCHFFFISHAYLLLREKKASPLKKHFCLFGSMHIIIVLHPNASFVWVIFTKSKLLLCLNKIFHKIAQHTTKEEMSIYSFALNAFTTLFQML